MSSGARILHTEWSTGWGGQEIRVVAESKAFRARGYDILIAAQPGTPIIERAREAGIPTIEFPLNKRRWPFAIGRAVKILRDNRVQLVHTHSSIDAWTFGAAAKLLGLPVVRSRHLSTPISRDFTSRLLYARLADRVITSGRAIKEAMVRDNRIPAERIVSVPAGIDEKRFSPSVSAPGLKKELGFDEHDFVVGIVAVLRGWKGHSYLIKAVAALRAQGLPIKLVIVGAGPQEEVLGKQIRDDGLEGSAVMTGHRADVERLFSIMDCVVLPSTKNEATSQVLPQAMAMKKPVIASDAGGLSEVVINNETGLLVPAADADALARAIRRLYEEPATAARLAERGYAHVINYFTFDHMIDSTESVYKELLGTR